MKKLLLILPALAALSACTNPEPNPESVKPADVVVPGEGNTPAYVPSEMPSFTYTIAPYGGTTATDSVTYPADDADLNPNLTVWTDTITVTYSASTATVEPAGLANITGADVDLRLPAVGLCKIIVTGNSSNGSLRISGDKKHLLCLDNLTLTSSNRPAINDQVKKRVFVTLKGESSIEDGATYATSAEDRKGCFFAEDHLIFGGNGVLRIKGNYRHGLATDGFLLVNPGATLVVTDAKKNAIHVKGSASENNALRGIEVIGGYVYANTSAPAGKAMKCDASIRLRGGKVYLATSGNSEWDAADASLSSSACLKSDLGIYLSGADVTMTATGNGAKAVNADGPVEISGGNICIAMTGESSTEQGETSTAKGISSKNLMTISGGRLNISTIGANSRAIDADGGIDVKGGIIYAFGNDWGLRTKGDAKVTNGVMLCGGTLNTKIENCTHFDYTNITTDQETVITSETGDATIAAFRWPTELPEATLLLHL